MNPILVITILRAILCEKDIKKWLIEQAEKSETPLDNVAVGVLYMILTCEQGR